jgi:hypothetical protein
MSDTPRTDAAQHEGLLRGNPIPTSVTTAEFARQLERELNAAKANAIDEAAKRMEEVDSLLSTKLFLPGRKTLGEAMEDFRARLIQAAKGEQP